MTCQPLVVLNTVVTLDLIYMTSSRSGELEDAYMFIRRITPAPAETP